MITPEQCQSWKQWEVSFDTQATCFGLGDRPGGKLAQTSHYASSAATSTRQWVGTPSMIQICRAEDGKVIEVSIMTHQTTDDALNCG